MSTQPRTFHITVLGRMVEHLGVQMYKHRDAAIAELVANSWDAGAHRVAIALPPLGDYNRLEDYIEILDDGSGMDPDAVEDEYLVIGRNRREDSDPEGLGQREDSDSEGSGRLVMGRKGIGKLAGFGIAERVEITTWRDGTAVTLTLDVKSLKGNLTRATDVDIPGTISSVPEELAAFSKSGTRLTLHRLKHQTPLTRDALNEGLARRFSRTIKGEMSVSINVEALTDPTFEWDDEEAGYGTQMTHQLPSGQEVRYWYGLSKDVIHSVHLRGFTVQVRGKTAQAPPFFFHVEGTASGQHGTKYLTGMIEADFLDAGDDSDSDIISTDRQEIDWEDERARELRDFGGKITREILREWSHRRGKKTEELIATRPDLVARVARFEKPVEKQLRGFLRTLGSADADPERTLELADCLIRAFEYRHFVDVIEKLDELAEQPDEFAALLEHIGTWRMMESRALLEIVKGRLQIVDKFYTMIVNDASETAGKVGNDNLHDLIAWYPWLLNPEWQVLAEEKTITSQLREWGAKDLADPSERERYDFLALADSGRVLVIEIKRSGYAATIEDLTRLETYADRLKKGTPQKMTKVFINSGNFNIDPDTVEAYRERIDFELLKWGEVHTRVQRHYEGYRALLDGEVTHPDFARREEEANQTRSILQSTAYRGPEQRAKGLGPQDPIETTGES